MTRYTSRLDAKTGLVTRRAFTEEEETARDAAEKDYADREPTRKWSELRNLRDELLQSSDWTQAADTALTDDNALGTFIRIGSVFYPNTQKGRRAAAIAAYWKNYARITEIRKVVRDRSFNYSGYNSNCTYAGQRGQRYS